MSLMLYNTMTRRKEEFIPLEKGKVKFYMCGPTVYDYIHIGNARAFIVFDVLRRFFEFLGFDVTYVMNLTDIDDRIIQRAAESKADVNDITSKFSAAFFDDLQRLGVKPATVYPRATENVDKIIEVIQKLVDKGFAYSSGGSVFFEVKKFERYGHLSGKKTDELRAGARIAVDEQKRNPLDFALWKGKKPGEPAWESPWGPGRPGWHIECSAMSMKHLGETFDIHAGGTDLIFPHHENEVAQSECATGQQFVRYWLHNGFLQIDGDKMSKSLGNFRTVREVLQKYSGPEIRLFFLQKHYRNPIDLTEEGLQSARSAVARLQIFYNKLNNLISTAERSHGTVAQLPEELGAAKTELVAAMKDDFNTPVALSKLFEMVREGNTILATQGSSPNLALLRGIRDEFDAIDSFFGIIDRDETGMEAELVGDLVELLITVRNTLRSEKNWKVADMIRDQLKEKGIILEDKPGATEWRLR